MDEHIHTGFVSFVTIGIYAVLFIWGLRLVAAKLTDYEPTALVGKSLGALVHFG
jgi:hypothetical protein